MTFEITVTRDFSASHQLRLYDGSLEPIHGHNWHVKVTVAADRLDQIGVVMDFHVLEKHLSQIVDPWDSRNLNDFEPFASHLNPSAENVALHIAQTLKLPPRVKLVSVEAWEKPSNQARVIL